MRVVEESSLQVERCIAAVVELVEDDVMRLIEGVEARRDGHSKEQQRQQMETAVDLQRR